MSAVVQAKAHAVVFKATPKDRAAVQVKAEKATAAGTTNALKAGGKLFAFCENSGSDWKA